MQPQNDIFFGNTHLYQFLPYIDVGGVLLELDLAVLDVKVEDGVIDPIEVIPANAHQLIVVTDRIEKQFVFNVFVLCSKLAIAF
jgi:hypothetical protein